MIDKGGNLNLRSALLLLSCVLVGSWITTNVSGQSERPRRVDPEPAQSESRPREVQSQQQQPPPQQPVPAQSQEQKPKEQQQGQQPPVKQPDPEPETIRINSRLVTVPVSVTDSYGQPVLSLRAEDFVLEEDGTVQEIQTLGEPGKTPLEMVLLFDVSRSIRNRFDFEREAASKFIQKVLKPGDAISIFSIGSSPKLSLSRAEKAQEAISEIAAIQPTEDSTAFFDTVVKAAQHISDSSNPEIRRVMIVLSDGEDTNSQRFKLGDAVHELQRAECLFYSINPSGPSIYLNRISVKGQDGMFKLATETGGMAFLPDKIEDLTSVFGQITAELQAQYLLGYYSTNETADGKFRRIKVKAAKNTELRIRARNGYFAPKE